MNASDNIIAKIQNAQLTWKRTGSKDAIYGAKCEGEAFKLRLNDFPDEVLLTLFVHDKEIDLEEMPEGWHFYNPDKS